MFIIETRSKPVRKWSKLMFVSFLVTGFGPMHMRVTPSQKKVILALARFTTNGRCKEMSCFMKSCILAGLATAITLSTSCAGLAQATKGESFYSDKSLLLLCTGDRQQH
jgi:hypothetical protein